MKPGNNRPSRYDARVTIRLEESMRNRLEAIREERGIENLNTLIRTVIKDYLQRHDS